MFVYLQLRYFLLFDDIVTFICKIKHTMFLCFWLIHKLLYKVQYSARALIYPSECEFISPSDSMYYSQTSI
jgi:hypothetical protein